jgi:predicted transcriptional regulator
VAPPVTAFPLTPEQCRRAREVLDWTPFDLAVRADVRITVVLRFEDGQGKPVASRIANLRRAFEAAGVAFLPDGSVRLEAPSAA